MRRILGLGSQSALLVPIEDCQWTTEETGNESCANGMDVGCAGFNSIPCTTISRPKTSLCLSISPGDAVDDSTGSFPSPFLDSYTWLYRSGQVVGMDPSDLLHCLPGHPRSAVPSSLSFRSLSIPHDAEAHQYRWASANTRWEVWGYPIG